MHAFAYRVLGAYASTEVIKLFTKISFCLFAIKSQVDVVVDVFCCIKYSYTFEKQSRIAFRYVTHVSQQ